MSCGGNPLFEADLYSTDLAGEVRTGSDEMGEFSKKGFILSEAGLRDPGFLYEWPQVSEVEDYIVSINSGAGHLTPWIFDIADCLELDPRVLVALVRRESDFREGVTGVNGVGLVQMTNIGIAEVNFQLGQVEEGKATGYGQEYFGERVDRCLSSSLLGPHWTPLYQRSEVQEAYRYHGEAKAKELMRKLVLDPKTNLVYGAVLLKTYLAVYSKSAENQEERFWKALRRYNGHPKHREAYATQVLKWAAQVGNAIPVSI